ncbi:MAG: hypothetical protein Q9225_005673 [Loekoesia sp. 1 TL-2023]
MGYEPLPFSLPKHTLAALKDWEYDLSWVSTYEIPHHLVQEHKSPLHLYGLIKNGAVQIGDKLEFNINDSSWRVELIESSQSSSFSARSVVPSPRTDIVVHNSKGFKAFSKDLLQAYDPVLNANYKGNRLNYEDFLVYRNGQPLENLAFIRSAYEIYSRMMKEYKQKFPGQ